MSIQCLKQQKMPQKQSQWHRKDRDQIRCNISIMSSDLNSASNHNTNNNLQSPSALFHNVWEYEHDPDDNFMHNIIKQSDKAITNTNHQCSKTNINKFHQKVFAKQNGDYQQISPDQYEEFSMKNSMGTDKQEKWDDQLCQNRVKVNRNGKKKMGESREELSQQYWMEKPEQSKSHFLHHQSFVENENKNKNNIILKDQNSKNYQRYSYIKNSQSSQQPQAINFDDRRERMQLNRKKAQNNNQFLDFHQDVQRGRNKSSKSNSKSKKSNKSKKDIQQMQEKDNILLDLGLQGLEEYMEAAVVINSLERSKKDQSSSKSHSPKKPTFEQQEYKINNTIDNNHRQLDILSHKYTSNLQVLMRQCKQMLRLLRCKDLKEQIEEYRKKVIKMQINCRSIKIGLRNNDDGKKEIGVDEKNNEYYDESGKYKVQKDSSSYYNVHNRTNSLSNQKLIKTSHLIHKNTYQNHHYRLFQTNNNSRNVISFKKKQPLLHDNQQNDNSHELCSIDRKNKIKSLSNHQRKHRSLKKINLHPLQHKKQQKKSMKTLMEERQAQLSQTIQRQKKKIGELAAKQANIDNHYNHLKAKYTKLCRYADRQENKNYYNEIIKESDTSSIMKIDIQSKFNQNIRNSNKTDDNEDGHDFKIKIRNNLEIKKKLSSPQIALQEEEQELQCEENVHYGNFTQRNRGDKVLGIFMDSKNDANFINMPQNIVSKPKIQQFSTSFQSSSQYRSYQELLMSKRHMLKNSISSTQQYLYKKSSNIHEEIDLLAKELDVINRNIWSVEQPLSPNIIENNNIQVFVMKEYANNQSVEEKYLYLRNERLDRQKEEERNREYFGKSIKFTHHQQNSNPHAQTMRQRIQRQTVSSANKSKSKDNLKERKKQSIRQRNQYMLSENVSEKKSLSRDNSKKDFVASNINRFSMKSPGRPVRKRINNGVKTESQEHYFKSLSPKHLFRKQGDNDMLTNKDEEKVIQNSSNERDKLVSSRYAKPTVSTRLKSVSKSPKATHRKLKEQQISPENKKEERSAPYTFKYQYYNVQNIRRKNNINKIQKYIADYRKQISNMMEDVNQMKANTGSRSRSKNKLILHKKRTRVSDAQKNIKIGEEGDIKIVQKSQGEQLKASISPSSTEMMKIDKKIDTKRKDQIPLSPQSSNEIKINVNYQESVGSQQQEIINNCEIKLVDIPDVKFTFQSIRQQIADMGENSSNMTFSPNKEDMVEKEDEKWMDLSRRSSNQNMSDHGHGDIRPMQGYQQTNNHNDSGLFDLSPFSQQQSPSVIKYNEEEERKQKIQVSQKSINNQESDERRMVDSESVQEDIQGSGNLKSTVLYRGISDFQKNNIEPQQQGGILQLNNELQISQENSIKNSSQQRQSANFYKGAQSQQQNSNLQSNNGVSEKKYDGIFKQSGDIGVEKQDSDRDNKNMNDSNISKANNHDILEKSHEDNVLKQSNDGQIFNNNNNSNELKESNKQKESNGLKESNTNNDQMLNDDSYNGKIQEDHGHVNDGILRESEQSMGKLILKESIEEQHQNNIDSILNNPDIIHKYNMTKKQKLQQQQKQNSEIFGQNSSMRNHSLRGSTINDDNGLVYEEVGQNEGILAAGESCNSHHSSNFITKRQSNAQFEHEQSNHQQLLMEKSQNNNNIFIIQGQQQSNDVHQHKQQFPLQMGESPQNDDEQMVLMGNNSKIGEQVQQGYQQDPFFNINENEGDLMFGQESDVKPPDNGYNLYGANNIEHPSSNHEEQEENDGFMMGNMDSNSCSSSQR